MRTWLARLTGPTKQACHLPLDAGCWVYPYDDAVHALQVPKRAGRAVGMNGPLTGPLHSIMQQEELLSARGDGKAFLQVICMVESALPAWVFPLLAAWEGPLVEILFAPCHDYARCIM